MHGERYSDARDSDDHIDLGNSAQVDRWASKLGISAERLRELIARVGPRVTDLEAVLSRPEDLD
jgi:hypothetical protein